MNLFKVFALLLIISMTTEAFTWPWLPRSTFSRRRRPHRLWSQNDGRLRRQQQQSLVKGQKPQPSSSMSTLARVRAATQVDIPEEPEISL